MKVPGPGPGTKGHRHHMPHNISEPFQYNTLITFDGGCQFYILPSGGKFNISHPNSTDTSTWVSNQLVLYSVNCNLTDEEYTKLWENISRHTLRHSFSSSLTPLLVVLTICVVSAWILIGLLATLRRYKRPVMHQLALIYSCVLLTVFYVHLHHFTRLEHMYGYESTDSFTQYYFGTNRSISIFVLFGLFMICECHVIISLYPNSRHRLWIIATCIVSFFVVQGWWVAGIVSSNAYHILARTLDWRIRVYFYLEIAARALYIIAYIGKVLSLWRYAFNGGNRSLAIVSIAGTVIPLLSMIVTAIPHGYFRWSVHLTIITRSVSLVVGWEWYMQTILYKSKREMDDCLGRLVTQHHVKEELKENLGDEGDGHGTFFSKNFALRILDKIQNPTSVFSDISILGMGTHHSDSIDEEYNTNAKINHSESDMKSNLTNQIDPEKDEIIQHYPIAKHKVTNQASALNPSTTTSRSLTRRVKLENSSQSVAESGNTDPVESTPSLVSPGPIPRPEGTPSSSVAPQIEAPPGFVPHPGFRSGDYNNEKH